MPQQYATLIKDAKKPVTAKPAAAAEPVKLVKPEPKADRPMTTHTNRPPAHLETREEKMPDGRRVTFARHAVNFLAVSKEKGCVILGLKGAQGAMPVMADYDELLAWWQKGRPSPQV
jgi:hypothetical protein